MIDKIAIVASVGKTRVPGYSNQATEGVDVVSYELCQELSYAFNNIQLIQNNTTKVRIVNSLLDAAESLKPNGMCLFYFHGHGDNLPNTYDPDNETFDQALVCEDGFLFDDEIDQLLRKFKSTQRIMTITDCCSSASIVEWKYEQNKKYPQVLHLAACRDDQTAAAQGMGGIMSRDILNRIYGYGYSSYSYLSFCQTIRTAMPDAIIRTTKNVTHDYLNQQLFT
jgi:Caspase domain